MSETPIVSDIRNFITQIVSNHAFQLPPHLKNPSLAGQNRQGNDCDTVQIGSSHDDHH